MLCTLKSCRYLTCTSPNYVLSLPKSQAQVPANEMTTYLPTFAHLSHLSHLVPRVTRHALRTGGYGLPAWLRRHWQTGGGTGTSVLALSFAAAWRQDTSNQTTQTELWTVNCERDFLNWLLLRCTTYIVLYLLCTTQSLNLSFLTLLLHLHAYQLPYLLTYCIGNYLLSLLDLIWLYIHCCYLFPCCQLQHQNHTQSPPNAYNPQSRNKNSTSTSTSASTKIPPSLQETTQYTRLRKESLRHNNPFLP